MEDLNKQDLSRIVSSIRYSILDVDNKIITLCGDDEDQYYFEDLNSTRNHYIKFYEKLLNQKWSK